MGKSRSSKTGKGKGRAAASRSGKAKDRAGEKLPEAELTGTTRIGQIMALPVEVIRLHLQQRHLSVTGNKREVAGRLLEALQRRSDDDSHGQETYEAEKGSSTYRKTKLIL